MLKKLLFLEYRYCQAVLAARSGHFQTFDPHNFPLQLHPYPSADYPSLKRKISQLRPDRPVLKTEPGTHFIMYLRTSLPSYAASLTTACPDGLASHAFIHTNSCPPLNSVTKAYYSLSSFVSMVPRSIGYSKTLGN